MTERAPAFLFAWPSSGRRETLPGSAGSFIENLAGHGDRSPCLFAFDAPAASLDAGLVRKITGLAACGDRKFLCSDRTSRERFINLLPASFDRDAVRYALLQKQDLQGVGTNRNAILLAGTGSVIVSTDDDVICKPAELPARQDGVIDVADAPPCQSWYYPDRESLLASVRPADIDVAAAYCSFFGSGKENGKGSRLVVCPGSYGDSGYGNARATLILEEKPRAHLHDAGYERMRFSREMVRIPPMDVSGNGMYLMGMQCALDARAVLPPFFPIGRNEDGFFALMLRVLRPGNRILYPSFGFLHDPPESRPFDRKSLVGFKPSLADLMMALSIALAPPGAAKELRARFSFVGQKMQEASSLSAFDFAGLIHDTWSGSAIAYAEKLESLLEAYDREPASWAADVGELIENVYEHVREPTLLFGNAGCGCPLDEVRRQANLYGRLLVQWPELVDYAASGGESRHGLTVGFGEI